MHLKCRRHGPGLMYWSDLYIILGITVTRGRLAAAGLCHHADLGERTAFRQASADIRLHIVRLMYIIVRVRGANPSHH